MEIDVRTREPTSVSSIRFHDAAVLKESDGQNLVVTTNTGDVLVTIPKTSVDAFVRALERSKTIFPPR
jgi:hypothetical protein